MSINHFSPDNHFPAETLWYNQQHHQNHHNYQQESQSQFPNQNKRLFFTQLYNNTTNYEAPRVPDFEEIEPHHQIQLDSSSSSSVMLVEDRDSMFEKHLTPSDVGKLNRLVIPKQHAEKYFPLNNHSIGSVNGVVESNGSGGEKGGLLLSFEDESGKCWRFRYSYWNSSQSYVLTKGWSRYVKEKRLDAGDVVLFERHRVHMDRFFIGWRRRGAPMNATRDGGNFAGNNSGGGGGGDGGGGGGGWARLVYSGSAPAHPYPTHPFPYQPDLLSPPHAGSNKMEEKKKKLRLFGVNMEVDDDEHESTSEPQTPDGSSLSSQGQSHIQNSSSSYNYPDYIINHTF